MKNMIEGMLQAELEDHLEQKDNTSKNGTYSFLIRIDFYNIYSPHYIKKPSNFIIWDFNYI